MSFKSRLNSNVAAFVASGGRGGGAIKRGPIKVSVTDLGADFRKLDRELLKKVCPTAVGYAATIVRKEAQRLVATGGSKTTLGKSRKTKTRGVPHKNGMKNVGRGSWSKKVWSVRGKNGKSLGEPGTIIKKNISRKMGGLMASQIVGPRYDTGPGAKNFAHTHEPTEGASSGAPNHKWWPQKGKPTRGEPLTARPFMRPAAANTIIQQMSALKKALRRWDIDPSETIR